MTISARIINKTDESRIEEHVRLCREYSRRKRALLERFPTLSGEELERQIKRIAREVGI